MTDAAEQLEQWRPLVKKIVYERIGTQYHLFDDAEQEAMIAFWDRLNEGHSMGIAIFKAKQAVIDVLRGRRMTGSKQSGGQVDSYTRSSSIFRTSPDGGEEYVFEPADHSSTVEQERFEDRDVLRQLLGGLRDREREIIHATFYEGLSRAEVAERYGVTHQAVSACLSRAYAKLRGNLAA